MNQMHSETRFFTSSRADRVIVFFNYRQHAPVSMSNNKRSKRYTHI